MILKLFEVSINVFYFLMSFFDRARPISETLLEPSIDCSFYQTSLSSFIDVVACINFSTFWKCQEMLFQCAWLHSSPTTLYPKTGKNHLNNVSLC